MHGDYFTDSQKEPGYRVNFQLKKHHEIFLNRGVSKNYL